MKKNPEIIFEDETFLAVSKPPGLRSIPDRYDPALPNVYHFLKYKYEKIFIIHRLDKPTSGLLLFAKTEAAHRHLSLQFENRSVYKFYLALVDGRPYPPDGSIESGIAPHPRLSGRMIISNKGKKAKTSYSTLEQFNHFTLLDVNIHTGRTHQIRVHLESIGHPLAVDNMYGRRAAIDITDIKRRKVSLSKNKEVRPIVKRTALHAWKLDFTHPETELPISLEAPLPKDFNALLNQLRKWDK